jgi:signal transduction protein with GAF and PtsI domain
MLSKKLGGEDAARTWWTNLAARIASARDAEDALQRLADGLAKDVDPYAFGVFLENPAGHDLVLKQRHAHGPLKDHPLTLHPEQGMVGFVFRHGVPLVVHDVARDPRYIRGPLADSVAALAVPVKSGHETIGAIDVESDETWTFDAQDVDGLQVLASALGAALARSRHGPARPAP